MFVYIIYIRDNLENAMFLKILSVNYRNIFISTRTIYNVIITSHYKKRTILLKY